VNLDRLYELVNEHRRKNGFGKVAESVEEFEDMFCRERVERRLVDTGGEEDTRSIDLGRNLEFLVLERTQCSLDEWKHNGFKVVDMSEVNRRAELCSKCDLNRALICTSCLGYDSWVYGYISQLPSIIVKHRLDICSIDKVMIIADIYRGDSLEEKRRYDYGRDYCWKQDK